MAHLGVVVADPAAPTAGDQALTTLFVGTGHTTAYVDDAAAVPGGFDAFVLSESSSPFSLLGKYRDIAVPVVCLEVGSYVEMGLADVDGANTNVLSDSFLLHAHEITAGLPSPCQVRTTVASQWGVANAALPSGAFKFASIDDTLNFITWAAGWAVDTGGTIHGSPSTAPARRVALGYIDSWPPNLTADGQQLLLNAVTWAAPAGGPTPVQGSATLAATSALAAAGRSPARGVAVLAGTTGLTASGQAPALGAAVLGAAAGLTAAGRSPAQGVATLAATTTLAAAAVVRARGSATLAAVSGISARAAVGAGAAAATLSATSGLVARGRSPARGRATLATTSMLAVADILGLYTPALDPTASTLAAAAVAFTLALPATATTNTPTATATTNGVRMKTGDLEPDWVISVSDAGEQADLNGVTSWRLIGIRGSTLVVDDLAPTVVVDPLATYKATVSHNWVAGETTHTEGFRLEGAVVATWPGGRPQTFPGHSVVHLDFEKALA